MTTEHIRFGGKENVQKLKDHILTAYFKLLFFICELIVLCKTHNCVTVFCFNFNVIPL